MSMQIERTNNSEDVGCSSITCRAIPRRSSYDDVPLQALLPAFMLSELKTAFLIGFQIYLPFLILDMVIASVTVSMGMMMLPPVLISLPFKDPAVRAGGRLAPGGANVDGEFSTIYVRDQLYGPAKRRRLARDAIRTSLVIISPVALAGLVVGLVVGLLQAVTQIQEQTVAFVPKIVVMIVVLGITLPWMITQMLQYSTELISGHPRQVLSRGQGQGTRTQITDNCVNT